MIDLDQFLDGHVMVFFEDPEQLSELVNAVKERDPTMLCSSPSAYTFEVVQHPYLYVFKPKHKMFRCGHSRARQMVAMGYKLIYGDEIGYEPPSIPVSEFLLRRR